jgi:hypothetical protein
LGLAANVLVAVVVVAIRTNRGPVERPAGMDDETFKTYQRGAEAAPVLDCCLISIPTLGVYPLVIAGGIRMRRLEGRRFAALAAVLAMAPCSPAMLFGLPIGVWALVVLSDPAVRIAFAGRGPRR